MNHLRLLVVSWLSCCAAVLTVHANPREANDMAFAIAKEYQDQGYVLTGTSHSGVLGGGAEPHGFLIQVVKGMDYVLIVGADQGALLVSVSDETGSAIVENRPANMRNGVRFRSPYSGTVKVDVLVARSNGQANYQILGLVRDQSRGRQAAAVKAGAGPAEGGTAAANTAEALETKIAKLKPMVPEGSAEIKGKMEDRLFARAGEMVKSGFSFAPDSVVYRYEGKSYYRMLAPVTKGLQYVIVAAANASTGPIHGYVTDEVGTFLTKNTYNNREFTMPFQTDFNGTAVIYIEVTDVDTIGQLAVLVGRRGAAK